MRQVPGAQVLRKHLLDKKDLLQRIKTHAAGVTGKGKEAVMGLLTRLREKAGSRPAQAES